MTRKSASNPNNKLKQERLLRGWTQNDVAGYVGTDGYTVNRWERGRTVPSPHFRQKLCELFGKSAEELGFIMSNLPDSEQRVEDLMPTLWYLAFRRNPFFTGRENILSQIYTYFQQDKENIWQPMIAVCGLPGLGKTQIAIEYAHRYASEYQAVFWVQADTPTVLQEGFLSLAPVLGLAVREISNQALLVQDIKAWLRTHSYWLLIFDNVEEPESIQEFLPTFFTGHVLLTTHTQFMGTLAHCININVLPPEDGVLFLLRRIKVLRPRDTLAQATEPDSSHAKALVRLMGGLPLALDQAATYIDETSCTITEYLQLYLTQSSHLLNIRGTFNEYHPMSVSASFALAIEKLAQINPIAVTILQFCALLFPAAIPEEFMVAHVQLINENIHSELYYTLLEKSLNIHIQAYGQSGIAIAVDNHQMMISTFMRELRRFSFLLRNAETKTVSMHRLVQEVVKESMDDTLQRLWAEHLIKVVNKVFSQVHFSSGQIFQRYLPYALTCATFVERWNIVSLDAAFLLACAGAYLLSQAHDQLLHTLTLYPHTSPNSTEIKSSSRHILATYSYAFPDKQFDVASIATELALLSRQQNNYVLTEPLLLRAISIYEQVVGANHTDLAECLSNLANLYETQGKLEQSETLYTRALQIFEMHHREDKICALLRNIAWLALALANYERAESLLQHALHLCEKRGEISHPDIVQYMEDYALVLRKVGKQATATEMEDQAKMFRSTLYKRD